MQKKKSLIAKKKQKPSPKSHAVTKPARLNTLPQTRRPLQHLLQVTRYYDRTWLQSGFEKTYKNFSSTDSCNTWDVLKLNKELLVPFQSIAIYFAPLVRRKEKKNLQRVRIKLLFLSSNNLRGGNHLQAIKYNRFRVLYVSLKYTS